MELTHAFDANWLSLQVELAEASVLIGDATFADSLYERLAPYADRPDAVRHLEDAIQLNDAFGAAVWRARAERDFARTVSGGPLVG